MASTDSPLGRIALVTGASRGTGAVVAQMLAERGGDVVINYRSKGRRADEVANEIRALGRRVLPAQADITDHAATVAMFDAVGEYFGRLDLLILNASGGLEKDRPAAYAMDLNLTAQVRCLDLAMPLMPQGSRVLFVTSHYAHFHGSAPVPTIYEPVAVSKRAGEDALRARMPELSGKGISLVVVSGDLIEGTITPRLMERQNPGLIDTRREQVGWLPTTDDFARAIVDAAANISLETGATIYVGSTQAAAIT